jgi:dolichyl-phosphate beta-glucosyltransferase
VFNLFVRACVLPGVIDSQCGFKLFEARAAHAIFARQRLPGFSFDVEVLFLARRLGFGLAEVPVHWTNSPASRVHPVRDSFGMLRDLLRVRWNAWRGKYD